MSQGELAQPPALLLARCCRPGTQPAPLSPAPCARAQGELTAPSMRCFPGLCGSEEGVVWGLTPSPR